MTQAPVRVGASTRSHAEQLALVYRLLPAGLAATLGVACFLAWGLWGQVPAARLLGWLGLVLLISAARWWNVRAWRRAVAPDPMRWQLYFCVGAAAGGTIWGLAGTLLFPDAGGGQLLLAFTIAGMAAGGMSTLAMLPGAYALYLLASVLPFSVRLLTQADAHYSLMGWMVLLYAGLLLSASRQIRSVYGESLRLRFENENLLTQVTTDTLTGTFNRAKLEMALPCEMRQARRYRTPLAVILFDIDHFKYVNDRYGHQVGDQTLVQIARRAGNQLREADALFRWGGEEFMVLMPNTDLDAASQLAERLRQAIEQLPLDPAGVVTCSFGCTQLRTEDSKEMLLQRADQALYAAKADGRNCVKAV